MYTKLFFFAWIGSSGYWTAVAVFFFNSFQSGSVVVVTESLQNFCVCSRRTLIAITIEMESSSIKP